MKSFDQLLKAIETKQVLGNTSVPILQLTADSRLVEPGTLFVALRGTQADGAQFIEDAVHRGAAALVSEVLPDSLPSVPFALVDDARSAIGHLAAELYGRPADRLRLIGITGTDGKTSVAYLVSSMLTASDLPCAYIGTLGARVGTSETTTKHTTPPPVELNRLLCWAEEHGASAVSLETSSHGLKQKRLAGLRLSAAVFTTFGRDHLDYHATPEDYLSSKLLLFDALAPDGTAVVNGDQADIVGAVRQRVSRLFTFSASGKNADVIVKESGSAAHGTWLRAEVSGEQLVLRSKLLGSFQVENLSAALAVGVALGLSLDDIRSGLEQVAHIPGRFQPVYHDGRLWALVDYAHTPGALEKALDGARALTQRKVIVVFGCGGDRDQGKRALMGKIASRLADLIIVTSDNPRSENPEQIINDICQGMPSDTSCHRIADRRSALRHAVRSARAGDVILVAGKGHETTQEVRGRFFPFNDAQELTQLTAHE